jgi:hypothetical protein
MTGERGVGTASAVGHGDGNRGVCVERPHRRKTLQFSHSLCEN